MGYTDYMELLQPSKPTQFIENRNCTFQLRKLIPPVAVTETPATYMATSTSAISVLVNQRPLQSAGSFIPKSRCRQVFL